MTVVAYHGNSLVLHGHREKLSIGARLLLSLY
jgi:hypothetical protein